MVDFACVDCGFDTSAGDEYYMVSTPVWLAAGMRHDHRSGDGMLCIGCLEGRLGRRLQPNDFPDYPINRGAFRYSARLADRLGVAA